MRHAAANKYAVYALFGAPVAVDHGAVGQHGEHGGVVLQHGAGGLDAFGVEPEVLALHVAFARQCQRGDGVVQQAAGVFAQLHGEHQRLHEVDRIADHAPVVGGWVGRCLQCAQAAIHSVELVGAQVLGMGWVGLAISSCTSV